jgi:hypothetical protein
MTLFHERYTGISQLHLSPDQTEDFAPYLDWELADMDKDSVSILIKKPDADPLQLGSMLLLKNATASTGSSSNASRPARCKRF